MSTGTLAVGCEKGIFIWTVEFSNMHARPSVNNVGKFTRDDHRYITGLSWNKMVNTILFVGWLVYNFIHHIILDY